MKDVCDMEDVLSPPRTSTQIRSAVLSRVGTLLNVVTDHVDPVYVTFVA